MSNPIERRLAYEDDHQHRRVIGQENVAAIVEPVVILGDPGLGKSFLARSLGAQPNMKYYRAGKFERTDKSNAPDSRQRQPVYRIWSGSREWDAPILGANHSEQA